ADEKIAAAERGAAVHALPRVQRMPEGQHGEWVAQFRHDAGRGGEVDAAVVHQAVVQRSGRPRAGGGGDQETLLEDLRRMMLSGALGIAHPTSFLARPEDDDGESDATPRPGRAVKRIMARVNL